MSDDLSDLPEDLREYLERFPPAEESIRQLEAMKTDLEASPTFVSEFLKALFVNDIWAALEDQKLSQSDLAERLGESRQYVSKVLKEQANFTIESMAKLACALGLSLTIRLHRRDERMEIVPISRRKKNIVKLRGQAGTDTNAASVGEGPAVYEGGRKARKSAPPRKRTDGGKSQRRRQQQ